MASVLNVVTKTVTNAHRLTFALIVALISHC